MPYIETPALIVGASISGLACAACCQRAGIGFTIIEKEAQIAMPWRRHYERLHLHTSRRVSGLPFQPFDSNIPRYPSRQQVINYLENYRRAFDIRPVFNTSAISIVRDGSDWITETNTGIYRSKFLIMATGAFGQPRAISLPGLDTFRGRSLHSADYRSGADFKGQRVLVVGFGNSACEIAIDLYEQGACPSMAVRSPVNIIPRDILGIPVVEISLLLRYLPPAIADRLSAPLINLIQGDITRLGLRKKPYGSLEQIAKEAKAPILDIGVIKLIREGHIKIFDEIEAISEHTIRFKSGRTGEFDAILAAIGYDPGYTGLLHIDPRRLADLRHPIGRQQFFGEDGLYFCGYWISPTGQIREITLDAQAIAKDIAIHTSSELHS